MFGLLPPPNRIHFVNKPTDFARIPVDHDTDTNVSSNEHFSTVLEARLSRRSLLRGGAATAASALLGVVGLSGCGGSDNDTVQYDCRYSLRIHTVDWPPRLPRRRPDCGRSSLSLRGGVRLLRA
jgi:hypothetical protein